MKKYIYYNKMNKMEMKTDDLEIMLIEKYKKKQSDYDRQRYLKNKELLQQKYIENRDKMRLYQNDYYINNKQRYKDYYIKNADRRIKYNRNYKLQKKQQLNTDNNQKQQINTDNV